jgi:uncharacterized DUF497 family protein
MNCAAAQGHGKSRNGAKYGVTFEDAMTVFRDRLARSILDRDHGPNEERWVTLGEAFTGNLLVVVHAWREMDPTGPACASSRRVGRPGERRGSTARKTCHELRQHERRIRFLERRARQVPSAKRLAGSADPPRARWLAFLTARAQVRGITLNELVNALLKKDIELIEAAE